MTIKHWRSGDTMLVLDDKAAENARLLAAAPDLLLAAKLTLVALEKADIAKDTLIWIDERDLLFAAIAKAEGA